MKSKTETLNVRKRFFFAIASDSREHLQNILPTDELVKELKSGGIDIFTFLERKWCCPIANPSKTWVKAEDNVAILHLTSYDEWLKNIGKKTRNMIRKSEKGGVRTDVAKVDDKLAEGVWKIFNESPVRQGRAFPHYGVSLETVKKNLMPLTSSTYIGAFFENELIGFIQMLHGDRLTMISQLLSLQKYRDKALNNALMAKAVEVCAKDSIEWVMYGRIGNHPSLDIFKESNGFTKLSLTRYFLPLSAKGRLAIRLRIHRELKDTLPPSIKKLLFPVYSWASRTKTRIKLKPRPKQIT
jgi:Acetyltransferase (GNAT) family